ncbi:MAG: bifunctional methylenetetrahydrofolate dehydrogenase/methenyltetrahydrofolate cyclohydrolase FolD [Clostridia bacterium]|nr:bifunctional methylenetetrahydrofolate dehydrogenase/methenyltetrahydrofolate cyclohydrolase FolD [Clostridia bacterium]
MAAFLIDGKEIAGSVKAGARQGAEECLKKGGRSPALAVILVGEDPASQIYVKNKAKACEACGITSLEYRLPADTDESEVLALIERLNKNDTVDGILCQLPLPAHVSEKRVTNAISPDKDVDGFHPVNVGRLYTGEDCFVPCTPAGILRILYEAGVDLTGKRAAVIGRSNIVGKPVAALLLQKNATVTVCHSKTPDVGAVTREADVVVAAVGRSKFLKADMVKPGAVVIDVGINRGPDGKLSGDVDFDAVREVAGAITPVPGGVGPMTIAMLMENTVKACRRHLKLG